MAETKVEATPRRDAGQILALDGRLEVQRTRHDAEVCSHEFLTGITERVGGISNVANVERYLERLNGKYVRVVIEWNSNTPVTVVNSLEANQKRIEKLEEALDWLANNDLTSMNCASVEIAAKRVRNFARAALKEEE